MSSALQLYDGQLLIAVKHLNRASLAARFPCREGLITVSFLPFGYPSGYQSWFSLIES